MRSVLHPHRVKTTWFLNFTNILILGHAFRLLHVSQMCHIFFYFIYFLNFINRIFFIKSRFSYLVTYIHAGNYYFVLAYTTRALIIIYSNSRISCKYCYIKINKVCSLVKIIYYNQCTFCNNKNKWYSIVSVDWRLLILQIHIYQQ